MKDKKNVAELDDEMLEQVTGGSLADCIGNMSDGQSNQNNNFSNNQNKIPSLDEMLNNPTISPKVPVNGLPDISLPKDIGDM